MVRVHRHLAPLAPIYPMCHVSRVMRVRGMIAQIARDCTIMILRSYEFLRERSWSPGFPRIFRIFRSVLNPRR